MTLDIDKIYITHWSKLTNRKKELLNHLHDCDIFDFEFIENYDKDMWNIEEIISEFPVIFKPNVKGRFLRHSEISLALKHCFIIKESIKNGYKSIIIFEDDVRLVHNFIENFNCHKKQLPDDWDLFFFGTCCDLHIENIEKGLNVYKAQTSRCCHAYAISENGLSKILDGLHTINDAIDWYYNYIIPKKNLNVFWSEPALAFQSELYFSTVQN